MTLRSEKVLDWLVPCLLTATLGVLGWMGLNISEISKNLAVAVYKIDDHERRINRLENLQHERDR